MKKKIKEILWIYTNLSDYQWFRKWYGGRWEKWWIEACVNRLAWMPWNHTKQGRPGACWELYDVEVYP